MIEAAFEEMGVKRAIFTELDRIAKPGAILATNTSYLDVNAIAAVTSRPQDVLGMHFFSPANVMRLVEVVRAEKTAPDALATALDLGRRLNKLPWRSACASASSATASWRSAARPANGCCSKARFRTRSTPP